MIKLENVSKKYGEFYAVKKLNFEIKEGEIVGLLGRNGAGKSTTMNMITGFIESTEGKIIIGGYDVDINPKKVKALIGYMPEGVPLYTDLTVKEFVSYMADLRLVKRKNKKMAVEKAINDTGLDKVKNKLVRNLSRGYKQRVSLAGALVGEPKILILDEPTVGLDPEQVIEIRELIKSLGKNHTVILSSHILSEVSQICEKVIIIDKGEILAVDTPKNLENNTDKDEDKQLTIIIEDPEDNFKNIKEKISDIKEFVLQEELEDNSKKYAILVSSEKDIRKQLSIECSKSNIIILEMKQEEKTLEDAFIKIVEDRPEISQKEREEIDKNMELEELREEAKEKKRIKEEKKKEKEIKKQENSDNEKKEKNQETQNESEQEEKREGDDK
ncbi:MAG: ABC transporter ATP-binding protein [Clostridia bacterium]|nr:ABC transporter ATP-binding protein [Clostridia bacterium]